MVNHTFPQTGDFSDGENFANLMGQTPLLDYVETGMNFQNIDYNALTFDISSGKAYVSLPDGVTANTGETRTILGYVIETDAVTGLSLTDNTINYVFVEGNAGTNDSPAFAVNTTDTPPTDDAFKIGEIDTNNNVSSDLNRTHPMERLVQSATPSHDRTGTLWYKDSNGLVYFDDGSEFSTVPAVGYQDGNFNSSLLRLVSPTASPRIEVNASGSLQLIGEQTIANFETSINPNLSAWSWSSTTELTRQNSTVLYGSYSAEFRSNGVDEVRTLSRLTAIEQDIEFSVQIGSDTANINDFTEVEVGDDTDYSFGIRFNDGSGNVEFYDVGGGTTQLLSSWNTGQTYDVEFDPDYVAGEVDVYIDGNLEGNALSFTNSLSATTRLKFRNNASNQGTERFIYLDNILEGARESGEIILVIESVDDRITNWDIFDYTESPDNETITLDVEDGTNTVLISDIAQKGDISSISTSTNFQVRVSMSRNSTSNNPTLDTWYRRFTKSPGDTGPTEEAQFQQKRGLYINNEINTRL